MTFEPIDDETEDDAPDRPRRAGRRVRKRELREQLAAANAELGRVNRRADFLDDTINGLRQQAIDAVKARNAATERAEKAERAARLLVVGQNELDRRWAEAEQARMGNAYASGWHDAIAAHRAPGWAEREAGWRKYREQLAADAAPDGRSGSVADVQPSDGHGEGSGSGASPERPAEATG